MTNQILNYMRPNFKQKWLPSIRTFCNKPSIGCICREDGTLGVARKITKEGINGETNHNLYKISTNYPETLQIDANTPIVYSYLERVNSDVYGDITLDELKTQVDKEFIAGIENSYTKQYNPETYQRLLDIIEGKKHTK